MFYPSSMHTHTQFCDGASTMREMCEKALSLGYQSLGFSPHSVLPYENDWSMTTETQAAYLKEAAALKKEYAGRLEIAAGIELDADTPLCPPGLDFVIGAVHSLEKNGERFAVDYERDLLRSAVDRLYGGDFLELCRDYYEAVYRSALRPEVGVVAHFDLVLKYNREGCFVDENSDAYLAPALDAANRILDARNDLIFEINVGGVVRAARPYPYPAPPLISLLCRRKARFIITFDCHRAELLGAGAESAEAVLRDLPDARLLLYRDGAFRPWRL